MIPAPGAVARLPHGKLAAALTAPVEIAIRERRWPLLVTNGVLLDCERMTGVDMLNSFRIDQAASAVLLPLFWLLLARAGAEYSSPAEVGDLITLRSLFVIRRRVLRAWVASMPERRRSREAGVGSPEKQTHIGAWAFARMELGLSTEEWLDATPRMIQELADVRLRRMQWQEMMNGINTSETVNHSFCRPEKARTAESFMIHPLEDGEQEAAVRDPGTYLLNQFLKVKGTKIVGYKSHRV